MRSLDVGEGVRLVRVVARDHSRDCVGLQDIDGDQALFVRKEDSHVLPGDRRAPVGYPAL